MLRSKDLVENLEKSTGLKLGDREWLLELSSRHHQGWNTPRVGGNKLKEEFGNQLPYIESGIILDAGCSRGWVSRELARYYERCQIIGIDIKGNRLQSNPEASTINFRKGDFYRLHKYFPSEYFVAIFAMCNLTHVSGELSLLEHVLIAENFNRALKERGYLCISGGGTDSGIVLRKERNDFKLQYMADEFRKRREFSSLLSAYEIK